MGWMCHHTIVVTSWKEELLTEAHAKAVELGCTASPITPVGVNGYRSFAAFFVAPDGSKEGWDRSDIGDVQRLGLLAWMDQQRYEDGSTALDWVEVQFGEDDYLAPVILDDGNARMREFHENFGNLTEPRWTGERIIADEG